MGVHTSSHPRYIVNVTVTEYDEHGQNGKTVGSGSCSVYDEEPKRLREYIQTAGEIASRSAAEDFGIHHWKDKP